MKKVILDTAKEKTVEVSHVNWQRFYGVLRDTGRKGFITARPIHTTKSLHHEFRYCVCTGFITMGDSWPGLEDDTLQWLIKKLINNQFEVYEFDTDVELFEWLAKR